MRHDITRHSLQILDDAHYTSNQDEDTGDVKRVDMFAPGMVLGKRCCGGV